MISNIPVIDLFAGPGGLGEGFTACRQNIFKINLSIEMNKDAQKTLELRSFFHQFKNNKKIVPKEYYNLLKGKITRDKLFGFYPLESENAKKEAWCAELGKVSEEELDYRIREALNGRRHWLLIGGPPCQAYSLAGRSRVGGIKNSDHRVYLYKEYLRTIAIHHPAVFVMENVKGLLSAKINGESVFDLIIHDLKDPGATMKNSSSPKYRIFSLTTKAKNYDHKGNPVYCSNSDFLIRAEDYGIPQKRHRVILLGVREDIEFSGDVTLNKTHKTKLRDVIGDLPVIRSRISRCRTGHEIFEGHIRYKYKKVKDSNSKWLKIFSRNLDELKIKNSQSINFEYNSGSLYIPIEKPIRTIEMDSWYRDKRIGGVCNHESRAHLRDDLKRYVFASNFMLKNGVSPKLCDFPDELLPTHKNAKTGKFVDRFRVQNPEAPATTITSHISKDGHYFIHYDMNQCRSLTVREAARIQTFPDNYFFCGSRTSQFHQVGNAVPPLLAAQIAEVVKYIFLKNI